MDYIKDIKTIFFDYDGTLHESIRLYAPAFRKCFEYLVSIGVAEDREWSDEEISVWLGYNKNEMWQAFMPELPDEIKSHAGKIIGYEMGVLTDNGLASLYDGTIEVLSYLKKKGYRLVFLSNCSNQYMNSHRKLFKLDQYFDAYYTAEEFNYIPKHEILSKVIGNYPKECVMVGDRDKDIEAGIKNSITTIGCSYGYGDSSELEAADYMLDDINRLIELL